VSGATGHVVIPEPCGAVVLVPRSRGNVKAFLRMGRAWSCEARGYSGALSCRVTGSMLRARGNTGDLSRRVARSVPRARGDTGALSWRVVCSVPWGTW
jgi:hypothetical protein